MAKDIAVIIGQRIRNYRNALDWSQEYLAEKAGCHPTYIGQIERAEKNATIELIYKITTAMNVPLAKLFEKLGEANDGISDLPLKCYELVASKTKDEQEALMKILTEIDKYKNA